MEFKEFNKKIHYNVPITQSISIHETLGVIKLKNDGRFEWTRKKSDLHKNWNHLINGKQQGVCDFEQDGRDKILEGWTEFYECIITNTDICIYNEINGNLCSHCKLPDNL